MKTPKRKITRRKRRLKKPKLNRLILRKKKSIKKSNKKQKPKLSANKLKSWSRAIRTRDKYTCISCGSKKNVHAHHMVSKYYRPKYAFVIENGITLCFVCHMGKGGVHDKKRKPLNKFISRLRGIYKKHDINAAIGIGRALGAYSTLDPPKKDNRQYRPYSRLFVSAPSKSRKP